MFGTLRFILAGMVMLSHIISPFPFNYGIAAVAVFFMISGYVMTLLIARHFAGGNPLPASSGRPVRHFYLDRFLRIFPQYIVYVILTQISVLLMDFPIVKHFFSGDSTALTFLANALVIPTNYFFLWPALEHNLLIPPSWSLGLEEQFYLLFPFLVRGRWLARALTVLSVAVFGVALAGYLDAEIFAFRTLPGMLYIFMLGKQLADYRRENSRESLVSITLLYLAALGFWVWLWLEPHRSTFFQFEIMTAVITGFPLLAALAACPRRWWDEQLGHASYGIFLNHVLVANWLANLGLIEAGPLIFSCVLFACSTILAFASYFIVEKLVNPYRYSLRVH